MVLALVNIINDSVIHVTDVDAFGMTPLHILALTQQPKVEIFQQLPDVAKLALSSKDLFGSTPLIYLSKNTTVEGMEANRWLVKMVWDHKQTILVFRLT